MLQDSVTNKRRLQIPQLQLPLSQVVGYGEAVCSVGRAPVEAQVFTEEGFKVGEVIFGSSCL